MRDPPCVELSQDLFDHHPLPGSAHLWVAQERIRIGHPQQGVQQATVTQVSLRVFDHALQHVSRKRWIVRHTNVPCAISK